MKKKIIIFSCNGGGGHISAAKAIRSYLKMYDVITLDAMGESLVHLDPMYYLSFGMCTGQDLYNFLIRNNQKSLINLLFYIGCFLINIQKRAVQKLLTRVIERENPALVISVIPLINGPISAAADACNVPYLMVPTDFNIHSFVRDLRPPYDKKFRICLGLDYPEIRKQLDCAAIPNSQVMVTGFPIRASFFEAKNRDALKKQLHIQKDKPVVLLVMGAAGSSATLKYIDELFSVKVPFHLVVCVGRNKQIKNEINHLEVPDHIGVTAVDYQYDISDIMAIADVCISKPGSVTFAETLYMNVPVLLDNTTPSLLWEQFNLDFINNHGLGNVITNYSDVSVLITHYLTDEHFRALIRKNMYALKKKHFGTELLEIVDNIVGGSERISLSS